MTGFPYRLADEDTRARIGLIVLQVDETVEEDLRRLLPQARLHVTRIPSGAELTPGTIAAMEAEMTRAASLLPDAPFDVTAYACTSGTTLIGAGTVAARVRAGRDAAHVTNPLTAALAAMDALGIRSLGLVSPYIESVAGPIRATFEANGIAVSASLSFGEKIERNVARIDPASVREAALRLCDEADFDALFLSCTNLRTLDIIETLETETGRKVLSSNQVLAWHMARLSATNAAADAPGRLFSA